MRSRVLAAAAAVAALGVVAATASAGVQRAQANKLTVWLQVDAQSGWPDVVAAANKRSEATIPAGPSTSSTRTGPTTCRSSTRRSRAATRADVIEMGNTEMTKYMAAGAFADISGSKAQFDNSATWLAGLAKSAHVQGQGVRRSVLRGLARDHVPDATSSRRRASRRPRRASSQFQRRRAEPAKMKKTKGFSPLYVAGTDWYVAMSFVFDYGGSIARTHAGKWVGTLDSKKSIAGLTAFKSFFLGSSKASKTRTASTRSRTTSSRRAARPRTTGRPGTGAAPARSTRPSRRSS